MNFQHLKDYVLIQLSGSFDRHFYLQTYPDVQKARVDPLLHFVVNGWREGRNPSAQFDTAYYLKSNPDVRSAGVNPLVHYLRHGKAEGRRAKVEKVSAYEHYEFDYPGWIRENEPSPEDVEQQAVEAARLENQPLISILLPVETSPVSQLTAAIDSVLAQTYPRWELCLVETSADENADRARAIQAYAQRDQRVHFTTLPPSAGPSSALNAALQMAHGEFIYLLEPQGILAARALFTIATALNQNRALDLLYADEDTLSTSGQRQDPFFKPDWSPDLLLSGMVLGPAVFRADLVKALGGFRPQFARWQAYDLALRLTERTARVAHLPAVLFHTLERPTPPPAIATDLPTAVVEDALKRRGHHAVVTAFPGYNQVIFNYPGTPLISIIIPSDNLENIQKSIRSIIAKTRYPHIELVIVANAHVCDQLRAENWPIQTRVVNYDGPYNFSRKCNLGASFSEGEFVLFLNDDVYPQDESWIDAMLGLFQQSGVGAVAPKLVYPSGLIQHAGLVMGVRNLVGTAFHAWLADTGFYFNLPRMMRTVSALSAACLLMRRELFEQIGGFDEIHTPIMHSDLDLCFKIREAGLRLVYTPHVQLEHVGHLSIKELESSGARHSQKANIYLLKRWGKFISEDPYYPTAMRDRLYFDSPRPTRQWLESCQLKTQHAPDIFLQVHDLSLSGAPYFTADLAAHLDSRGCFTLTAAGAGGKLVPILRQRNLPVLVDPLIMDSPQALLPLFADFDLVIASTILSWKLVQAATRAGKTVLWIIHESEFGAQLAHPNPQIQESLSVADAVVFPSQQAMSKFAPFKTRENFTAIIYGVDQPQVEPFKRPAGGPLKITLIGSIETRKGQDILIDALLKCPVQYRERMEVSFIGRVLEADYAQAQKQRTAGLEHIHWLGELSRSQTLAELNQSDVLVCASHDEAGPLVVMEAMSLGKVVISTPVGSVPEFITDGQNGFIFGDSDSTRLAQILTELADNPAQMAQMGQNALQTYHQMLTRKGCLEKLDLLIDNLINQNNTGVN